MKIATIGIDANEANLVQHRLGSNQFAYGLLKTIEKIDTAHSFQTYLSTPLLDDMPKKRLGWNYRVIPPHKLWTQWRLPIDLYLKFPEQLLKKDLLQLKLWTAYSLKVADHIIAISEFTKQDILDNYQIDKSKISVIYPGYDKDIFNVYLKKKNGSFVLKKYNIDTPYLLFLGALKPSKNLERLIEAFNQLNEKNIKLVVAGKKGWLKEKDRLISAGLERVKLFDWNISAKKTIFLLDQYV